MKSFVALLAVVAVVAADVSHLRTGEADAQILKLESEVEPEKYNYAYQTSNGISGQESGVVKNPGSEDASITVEGSNSYTSPEGKSISIIYEADEFGYRVKGDHLPTPPPPQPIPEYIARAIAYIAAHPPQSEPIRRA